MTRTAVVGSSISGLSAAYYLSRRHEVHVFERDNRLGGHTHTVNTGFIAHNYRNYPNFCRLMVELGVETQPSDMSFAVTGHDVAFEYSSRDCEGAFRERHISDVQLMLKKIANRAILYGEPWKHAGESEGEPVPELILGRAETGARLQVGV